jgi:hypothetical protein
VHAAPCSQNGGGGHYKIDPTVTTTDAANELWLPVTADASGNAVTEVDFGHLARGDALSVVVHDPSQTGTPKMACADLGLAKNTGLVASGKLAPFAQAEALDQTISGTVRFTRNATGSQVDFNVNGLDGTSTYASHVHALPCNVNAAGGHYKLDTTVTTTDQTNELWLTLGDTSNGQAQGNLTFAHSARLDAQSVVIHRGTTNAIKVACADLPVTKYPDISASGSGTLLPAAADRGYTSLSATGQLIRTVDGTTNVHLEVVGAKPSSSYPAHVHNLPCAVQNGGGHYKRNLDEPATLEANELWVNFTTNGNGGGKSDLFASHTARADARSIVIHDTDGATRIACIDLVP